MDADLGKPLTTTHGQPRVPSETRPKVEEAPPSHPLPKLPKKAPEVKFAAST